MNRHAGGIVFQSLEVGEDDQDTQAGPANGLRHFIRTPRAEERYRISGRDPLENPAASRDLLGRLAKIMMRREVWSTPLDPNLKPWENPHIPGGYTYLAQIVAHDIVQSAVLAPDVNRRAVFRNHRDPKLDLDTLYSGGPVICPHAYAVAEDNDLARIKLALGVSGKTKTNVPDAVPPLRDISRTTDGPGNGFPREGLTEARVADPRNDDNAIISQLLTVFIHLHNGLVDWIAKEQPVRPHESYFEHKQRLFTTARDCVEILFRRVVRRDMMTRFLHPDVRARYDKADPVYLDPRRDNRVSLEFAQAAFRFGHAMVRPDYKMADNDLDVHSIDNTLITNSARRPFEMPMNETWIIQWPLFFDFGDGLLHNHSRRIGPNLSGTLEPITLPTPPNEDDPVNLGHRDLMRSAAAGVWSVGALIEAIRQIDETALEASQLCKDPAGIEPAVRQWLTDIDIGIFLDGDVDALAKDPPLPFYVLFEAFHECDGRHLGVLGSLLVAETIYKSLDVAKTPAADVEQVLDGVQQGQEVSTMPDLIRLTSRLAGLDEATPPFI